MKKIILSMTLILVLILFGCSNQSVSTSVKVVGLTYSNETNPSNVLRNNTVKLNSSKNEVNSNEYIFPGDELIFTVEIEDPNFEIISFLAIVFYGNTIRANTADSIVTSRDCGSNICLDFPFVIQSVINEYSVTEVKFAKLNNDGVNAIIDNTSKNSILIDIYNEDIYPYVEESVKLLNNQIALLQFYSAEEYKILLNEVGFDTEYNRELLLRRNLMFYNVDTARFFNYDSDDYWYEHRIQIDFVENAWDGLETQAIEFFNFDEGVSITLFVWEESYDDMYFYNETNKLYLNIGTLEIFIMEFSLRTKIDYTDIFS